MYKFLRTLSSPAMLNQASTSSDDYFFQPGECPNCQQEMDAFTTVGVLVGILFLPIRIIEYKNIRCSSCGFMKRLNNAT